jgi:hypothetical protein
MSLTLCPAYLSAMAYACPSCELAPHTYILKLQRIYKVLRTTGNFRRCTPFRDLHTAFNLPYIYDYITKLCRIQNHENGPVRSIGQGEARHGKYKRLKLGGGQAYDRSSDYAAVVA